MVLILMPGTDRAVGRAHAAGCVEMGLEEAAEHRHTLLHLRVGDVGCAIVVDGDFGVSQLAAGIVQAEGRAVGGEEVHRLLLGALAFASWEQQVACADGGKADRAGRGPIAEGNLAASVLAEALHSLADSFRCRWCRSGRWRAGMGSAVMGMIATSKTRTAMIVRKYLRCILLGSLRVTNTHVNSRRTRLGFNSVLDGKSGWADASDSSKRNLLSMGRGLKPPGHASRHGDGCPRRLAKRSVLYATVGRSQGTGDQAKNSVLMFRRFDMLRPGQPAYESLRIVDQDRQALRANPRLFASIAKGDERDDGFVPVAVEAVVGHGEAPFLMFVCRSVRSHRQVNGVTTPEGSNTRRV